jgi:hypothetical protein
MGVTVPAGTIGAIVAYPGRADSAVASQPDIEGNTIKIQFLHPSQIEIGIPIEQASLWITDVPINTSVTPT